MKRVLGISFGELMLKGANRKLFTDRAIKKIKRAIRSFHYDQLYMQMGKFYIDADPAQYPEMTEAIRKVFGIVNISPSIRVEKDMASIEEGVLEEIKQYQGQTKTFKVFVNRVDKSFTPKSPELSRELGAFILRNSEGLTVDIHNPQISVYVDIKEKAYIYTRRIPGIGGLPIGSSGKGMVLLSGGIDSPVAAFMVAKRGVEISGVHFHSYPFTSDRAFEKVRDLAEILTEYIGGMTLYSVNLLPIQKAIGENCREREMTILSRRFMMRIADRIAKEKGAQMLITGESLGQVASQTIEGLTASGAVTDLPILRPLVGLDKTEIIKIAEEIGTYETSILPFEDCCTVFLPKRPVTKPRLSDLERSEEALDVEGLVKQAVEEMEVFRIGD